MPYPASPVNPQGFNLATMAVQPYSGSPQYFLNGGHRWTINGGRQLFIGVDNGPVPFGTVIKALKRT